MDTSVPQKKIFFFAKLNGEIKSRNEIARRNGDTKWTNEIAKLRIISQKNNSEQFR
jgi:hypothetical protein